MVEWIFLIGLFNCQLEISRNDDDGDYLVKQNFGPGSTMKKALTDLFTELWLWKVL